MNIQEVQAALAAVTRMQEKLEALGEKFSDEAVQDLLSELVQSMEEKTTELQDMVDDAD